MMNTNFKTVLGRYCSLIALGMMVCCMPVAAQEQDAKDGEVAIGGEMILRIRVPADGKTVKQRVDDVNDRLPVMLGESQLRSQDIVAVKGPKSTMKIMVKNRLLLTVTPEDGKANGLTTAQQAQVWLKSLRRVLPLVNAKPNPNGP